MIGVRAVSKHYGAVHALEEVSFEVLPGELAFVIGASGSGKTTLLRLLHGDLRADGGTILIDGVDVSRLRRRSLPRYRRLVSIVPQDHRLLTGRTVGENLAFSLGVLGWKRRPARSRIDDVLMMVGLEGYHDRFPHELSGGERQRVVIARAIAGYPLVLLCDEPTGNLDPATSDGIVRLLEFVAAGGTTVVMSTHDAGVVDAARRRVLELDHGRLVRAEASGTYRAEPERIVLTSGQVSTTRLGLVSDDLPILPPAASLAEALPVVPPTLHLEDLLAPRTTRGSSMDGPDRIAGDEAAGLPTEVASWQDGTWR